MRSATISDQAAIGLLVGGRLTHGAPAGSPSLPFRLFTRLLGKIVPGMEDVHHRTLETSPPPPPEWMQPISYNVLDSQRACTMSRALCKHLNYLAEFILTATLE